jgi:amino acid transporter
MTDSHSCLFKLFLTFTCYRSQVSMIWGWVISSGFICFIGLAMSDLASSMPTSGGQSFLFSVAAVREPDI